MRMRPPRPRNVLPQVTDAASNLSAALGAVVKPAQPGLVRDASPPARLAAEWRNADAVPASYDLSVTRDGFNRPLNVIAARSHWFEPAGRLAPLAGSVTPSSP